MLKKSIFSICLFVLCASAVIANVPQVSLTTTLGFSVAHEVAPCTNGFDDVNVCKLNS